jgi:hypothetical protein
MISGYLIENNGEGSSHSQIINVRELSILKMETIHSSEMLLNIRLHGIRSQKNTVHNLSHYNSNSLKGTRKAMRNFRPDFNSQLPMYKPGKLPS